MADENLRPLPAPQRAQAKPPNPLEGLDPDNAEDIEKIRAIARGRVEAAAKKAKLEAMLSAAEREERIAAGLEIIPDEEHEETLYVDLALTSPYITLDGRAFWHGVSYTEKASVIRTLREIMWRTHVSEALRTGEMHEVVRSRGASIGRMGEVTTKAHLSQPEFISAVKF
jgi:hypothetical protein